MELQHPTMSIRRYHGDRLERDIDDVIYAPALHPHKIFFTPFIKTYLGYITFSTTMSGWRPSPSDVPRGWYSVHSDAWLNWKPEHPNIKALGDAVIFLKRNDTALMEEGPQ